MICVECMVSFYSMFVDLSKLIMSHANEMHLFQVADIFVQDLNISAENGEQNISGYLSSIKQEITLLWNKFLTSLPLLAISIIQLILFVVISRPVSALVVGPLKYASSSKLIVIVVQRSIHILIILLGVYFFLRLAGLSQFAVAVISGTGVMGIILGFAFRDIAENFISSLLLSVQRPFRLEDVIEVNNNLGIVKKVTARATTLVDFDGNHIQIPNATIYKNVIKNLTANPKMRGKFTIGIGYDAGIVEAQELATRVMEKHYAVLEDPEPQVLIDSLGASTINLKIYFWINSEEHSILKVASILMRLIVRAFEDHGLSMPDDAREVIFPQGVPLIKSTGEPQASFGEESPRRSESVRKDRHLDHSEEDVSSDTGDIRQQAQDSRDPESGNNII